MPPTPPPTRHEPGVSRVSAPACGAFRSGVWRIPVGRVAHLRWACGAFRAGVCPDAGLASDERGNSDHGVCSPSCWAARFAGRRQGLGLTQKQTSILRLVITVTLGDCWQAVSHRHAGSFHPGGRVFPVERATLGRNDFMIAENDTGPCVLALNMHDYVSLLAIMASPEGLAPRDPQDRAPSNAVADCSERQRCTLARTRRQQDVRDP